MPPGLGLKSSRAATSLAVASCDAGLHPRWTLVAQLREETGLPRASCWRASLSRRFPRLTQVPQPLLRQAPWIASQQGRAGSGLQKPSKTGASSRGPVPTTRGWG